MRTLFLLRGAPGAGKSTFIRNNNLENYTLSPDMIRTMVQCPVMNTKGGYSISCHNDGYVWNTLMEILERKMQRGETVFIDATHYRAALLNGYNKLIKKYRYRAFIVDFTDIPLEQCLKNNRNRDKYKWVPEETIRKMYACFTYSKEVACKFKIISRDECIKMLDPISCLFNMTDKYEKIYVFGDIHGCIEPLEKFESTYSFSDKNLYIFTGDYLDRGPYNARVANWLIEHEPYRNILFLEGNHEIWLRMFANGDVESIRSREFNNVTMPELIEADVSIKGLKKFCGRLGQMAYFMYGDKIYFISHGGVPVTPDAFTTTESLIKGVGAYEDVDKVYKAWTNTYDNNTVLIHAHRNVEEIPTRVQDNIYNLCSPVEFGKPMRCLEILQDGKITCIEFDSPTVRKTHAGENTDVDINDLDMNNEDVSTKKILKMMENEKKLINVKDCDNGIKSYNFTHKAFFDREWNHLTCTARGLFVKDDKVVARSYNKFFNIDERPETAVGALKKRKLPAVVYKKENGFLGLISAAGIFTKSTNNGSYVEIFKNVLKEKNVDVEAIMNIAGEENCTFVFECVDMKNDPHIIDYPGNEVFLLDIVYNSLTDYHKKSYDEVCEIAGRLNLKTKEKIAVCNTWEELQKYVIAGVQCKSMDDDIEGYVIEFDDGFVVKSKTFFYRRWKKARGWLQTVRKGRPLQLSYVDENEVKIASFIKSKEWPETYNIIDIQREYYKV